VQYRFNSGWKWLDIWQLRTIINYKKWNFNEIVYLIY